jgi:hypothetical protein
MLGIAVSVLFLVCCFFLVQDPIQSILLWILFSLCLVPWLLWNKQPNLFAPIYYTSAFLLIIYPIRTFQVLAFPDLVVSILPPPYNATLVYAVLLYSIFGISAYFVFYYCLPVRPWRIKSSTSACESNLKSWPGKIVLLYLIGWCARAYQIQTGNFRTWIWGEGYDIKTYTLLTYIGELSEIAYIFMWVYWLCSKARLKTTTLLLIICSVEVVFALTVQGSKIPFIRLMLFPLMAFYLTRGHLPVKVAAPAVLAIVFFVFPFVQAYRDYYQERFGQSLNVSLEEGASIAVDAVGGMYATDRHYSSVLEAGSGIWLVGAVVFLNRFHGFDSLAVMIKSVPRDFSFVYGKDLLTIPLSLIPRALWPEKPMSDVQRIFDKDITPGPGTSESDMSSSCPYPIAEGYFNGGLPGILLVILSLSFLQRSLYSGFYLPRKGDPFSIAVYIWFFIWVVEIGTWVLPAYTYLIQRLLVILGVWVVFHSHTLVFGNNHVRQIGHSNEYLSQPN